MADLPLAGVRATIEGFNDYLRNADQMNRATANIGNAAVKAGGDSAKGANGLSQLGKAAGDAGKNTDGLGTHIGQLGQNIGGLILKLAPLAAGIAGAFAIGKGIQAVDELGATIFRLQKQTNLTAEQASQLKFAFEDSGVSIQTGERALIKFSRALGGVADLEDGIAIPTGKAMSKTLFDLGVRTEDAEGKTRPLTDVLGDLAEQFKDMPDGIDKTSLATNLFGRNGKDLIPFLNQGRDGLKELAKEAGDLGLVLDQKSVDAIRKNELAMKRFHSALEGISVQIGLAFLPAMTLGVTVGTKLAVAFNQKVTPAIRLVANIMLIELGKFVRVVAPGLVRAFDLIGKGATVFRNAFLVGALTGNITRQLSGLSLAFKVLAAIAAVMGAALHASFQQIQSIITTLRVIGALVRAVITDFTNFNRILTFFPQPVQKVVHAVEDIVETITRAIARFLEWGRSMIAASAPLQALGARVGELTSGPLDKFATILDRLGKVIVPVLGGVITTFLGLLAVGTVLAFVATIDALVTAFAAFGPVKLAGQILGDFVKIAAKPIEFAVNLVGDALEGLGNIISGIGELAGKAFSFTVNLIGDAIDKLAQFLGIKDKVVTQTVNQEVVNTPETEKKLHPGPVSQEITQIVTGKGGLPSVDGQPAGKEAGKGFVGGFLDFITSALPNAVGNLLSGLALVLGTKLPAILAAIARSGISDVVIGAMQTAGEVIGAALGTTIGIVAAAALVAVIANLIAIKFLGVAKVLATDVRTLGGAFGLPGQIIGGIIASAIEGELGKRIGAAGATIVAGLALALGAAGKLNELIHNFQHFMDTKFFPAVSRLGAKAGDLFIGGIGDALSGLGTLLTEFPPPHINVAKMLKNVTNDLQLWVFNTLLPAVGRAFERLGDEIFHQTGVAFGRVNDALGDPLGAATRALEGFASDIKSAYFGVLHDINKLVGGALSEVGHTITDKLSTLSDTIDRAFGVIRKPIEEAWDAVSTATKKTWEFVSGFVGDKLTTLSDTIDRAFGAIRKRIEDAWDTVSRATTAAWNAIVGFVTDILGTLRDAIGRAFDTIRRLIEDAWNAVSRITQDAWNTISGIVTTATGAVFGIILRFVGAVTDAFTTLMYDLGRIWGTISGIVSRGLDAAWGVVTVAAGIAAGIFGAFSGLGWMIAGVFSGIGGNIVAALGVVVGIVNDVIDGLNAVINGLNRIPGVDINTVPNIPQPGRPPEQQGPPEPTGPPPGGAVLPGLPGSGAPMFASGTNGPLLAPTKALVAEQGRELVLPSLISRPKLVNLPSGAVVLSHGETESVLRSLTPRGGAGGTEHDFMAARVAHGAAGLANGTLARILSTLQALPQRGATISGDTLVNVPIDVDARGLDWEDVRQRLHQEIDRQLISSRSRSTRAGAPISGGIG